MRGGRRYDLILDNHLVIQSHVGVEGLRSHE